ncbi:MAG TPA: sucrose phosphorylase [Anaerolineales bacterium]
MTTKNRVQLITYPDSFGGSLPALEQVLQEYFPGLFDGGIHILPPFPSSADRGFSPLSYLEIAPEFGTWQDIGQIAENRPILLDIMVNHISAQSAYFQDFLQSGGNSPYADLFIPIEKIWPDGHPPQADLEKIFLRRQEPFSEFTIKETGKVVRMWTTFGKTTPSDQIDMDVNSTIARKLLTEFLAKFAEHGVKMVRLDAVGYVTKQPGTTCFFQEPAIYRFLEWISGVANSLGIDVLPEVHAERSTQFRLAEKGYWIYDFILPYTVIEALLLGTSRKLKEYLHIRPHRQFTMLDCHDGVPVKPDLNGMYESEAVRRVVAACLERGGDLSPVFSPRHKDPDGFDVHQIRGTFYSLLGGDDDAYLAARAIQFFTPGIPQVYYVGLLAGENDQAAVERTGDGREINRHNYSLDEIEGHLQRPVVQRLIGLIRFRDEYDAFNGVFRIHETDDSRLRLSWENQSSRCELIVDLSSKKAMIRYGDNAGSLADFSL